MKKLNKKRDPLVSAMDTLKNSSLPTEQQKENMLNHILVNSRLNNNSFLYRIGILITVYPWRFAFGISALQGIAGTLIFGTQYTNLFLRFFGGK